MEVSATNLTGNPERIPDKGVDAYRARDPCGYFQYFGSGEILFYGSIRDTLARRIII
jgi:hypothetical protein